MREAGWDLWRGAHREKAFKFWTEAVEEVKRRIKPPESLSVGDRQLNASMYHMMVKCLDMLGRKTERNQWLDRWQKEHPDDPQVQKQIDKLMAKHGTLRAGAR